MSEQEQKRVEAVEHAVMLTDSLVSDLLFMVRWHLSYNGTRLTKISQVESYMIQLGLMEETEVPAFLSEAGYGDMDIIEADVVQGELSTGETVQILDYFSKARSNYLGRAFVVSGDLMSEKTMNEGWNY